MNGYMRVYLFMGQTSGQPLTAPVPSTAKQGLLRWFWLDTQSHARLAKWFEKESLLEDVVIVEQSMVSWFDRTISDVKLPVNHFHLNERPHPTVKFLDHVCTDEPAFLEYLVSIPPESLEMLRQAITHCCTYLEANPHGGHLHRLIKPAMIP